MTTNGTIRQATVAPPPPRQRLRIQLRLLVGPDNQSRHHLARSRRWLGATAILLGLTLAIGLTSAALGQAGARTIAVEAAAFGFACGCWHALGTAERILRTLEAILDQGEA